MNQTEIIKELREILKLYHYESTTEQMSKDVVTSLENLLGSLMNSISEKEIEDSRASLIVNR
jgi:hypothetical protein